jgi:hypothetical protein
MSGPQGDDPELTRPVPTEPDGPTMSLPDDSPTMTGPTIGTWPSDATDADLGPLIWQLDPHPSFDDRAVREPSGNAGYYGSLIFALLLVLGLATATTVLALSHPTQLVAGSPTAAARPTSSQPEPTSTTRTTTSSAAADPLAELADHPLSSTTTRLDPVTCALPRFDPADAAQATFYTAAKVCADAAWRPLFPEASRIAVVTVQGGPADTPCGAVAPDAPATSCAGTVYLTPAHLRDGEGNGRYPGRYVGVFLREYAGALQDVTGLAELAHAAPRDAVGDRPVQQRICLAGAATGVMSGLGAVDTNITNEIRDRLTTVDAPPDAARWYDAGFDQRTPSACNTWS